MYITQIHANTHSDVIWNQIRWHLLAASLHVLYQGLWTKIVLSGVQYCILRTQHMHIRVYVFVRLCTAPGRVMAYRCDQNIIENLWKTWENVSHTNPNLLAEFTKHITGCVFYDIRFVLLDEIECIQYEKLNVTMQIKCHFKIQGFFLVFCKQFVFKLIVQLYPRRNWSWCMAPGRVLLFWPHSSLLHWSWRLDASCFLDYHIINRFPFMKLLLLLSSQNYQLIKNQSKFFFNRLQWILTQHHELQTLHIFTYFWGYVCCHARNTVIRWQ